MEVLNGIQAEKLIGLLQTQNVDADTTAVAIEKEGNELRVQIVFEDESKNWLIGPKGEMSRADARL